MKKEEKSELFEISEDDKWSSNLAKGMENYKPQVSNFGLEPEYSHYKKLGITDELYLTIGVDLRFLKKYNPKGKIIF